MFMRYRTQQGRFSKGGENTITDGEGKRIARNFSDIYVIFMHSPPNIGETGEHGISLRSSGTYPSHRRSGRGKSWFFMTI
jgi:hypothetical protein